MVFAQTSHPDVIITRLTLDEYRAMEETNPERHEYRNGEILCMSGGSEAHSAIASNLLIYLGFLLRDTNFRLYNSDLRVWIPEYQCGTYTDLMVVNGKPEFNGDRNDEILNPLLIVEVLSPFTEAYDRGEKFRKYCSVASFCKYLLVDIEVGNGIVSVAEIANFPGIVAQFFQIYNQFSNCKLGIFSKSLILLVTRIS
ncbi:MAG: Uma2 family endonuclease [Rhizonema sp. PD37]|nr:Uma2 family endonuclease [Rhizonema sp. PD37]